MPARKPPAMVPETDTDDADTLLTPAEVATLFRVTPKTVTRWAEAGKLPVVKTLGGHRRFPAEHVHRVRAEMMDGPPEN
jgi:excisionase family DNA binding protein